MNKILFGLFALVAGVIFSGCLKSKDPGCPYTESTKKAPDSQVAKVLDYLQAQNLVTEALKLDSASGVYYIVDAPGTTVSPGVCSVITFRYKGTFTDGTKFDEATTPVVYRLGELIVGWQKGLKYIKAGGGKIRMFIPWALGYGESNVVNQNTGAVIIPGKSILVFEVTLDEVQ